MAKVTQHGGPSYAPGEEPEGVVIGESGPEVFVPEQSGVVIEGAAVDGPPGPFKPLPEVIDGELNEHVSEPDYDAWTVDALKDELRGRELPVSGTKSELIDRLTEADAASDAEEPSE